MYSETYFMIQRYSAEFVLRITVKCELFDFNETKFL